MELQKGQFRALKNKVRTALKSGHPIAIIGWEQINHDRFTGGLPKEKIKFLPLSALRNLARSRTIGLVIMTKYVDHDVKGRIMKGNLPICPVVLDIWQIKNLLLSCRNVLATNAPKTRSAKEKLCTNRRRVSG